jgi:hypothetical protein
VTAIGAQGTALSVTGKAGFSRSGIAEVPSGQNFITVTMSGVTTSSMALATVHRAEGSFVKYVVPSSGSFKMVINASPISPTTVKVAYFLLN